MKNQVNLIGRTGKDVEFKTLDNGNSLATFTLATTETYKNKAGIKVENTTWHNIVIWGKLAEIANKYVKKGDLLDLTGRITNRSYDKDGITRYATDIECKEFIMLGSPKNQVDAFEKPKEIVQAVPNGGAEMDDLPF